MLKLIVSDLDGTLLERDRTELPGEVYEWVPRLREKGIRFAIATGRQYFNAKSIARELSDDLYFLTEDGAMGHHGDRLRYRAKMDTGMEEELIRDILKAPGAELWMDGTDLGYMTSKNLDFRRDVIVNGFAYKISDEPWKELSNVVKISLIQYGSDSVLPENLAFFREKYGTHFEVMEAGNGWLDFIPPGESKGKAVRFLMERFGIRRDEVAVFGDSENDISMFEHADFSYAMDTSAPHVKSSARYVIKDVVREVGKLLGAGRYGKA